MAQFVKKTKTSKPTPAPDATPQPVEPPSSMREIVEQRSLKREYLVKLWHVPAWPAQQAWRMPAQDVWVRGLHEFARLVAQGTP